MGKIIKPLSGKGKEIEYSICNQDIKIEWGEAIFTVKRESLAKILKEYFIDNNEWYNLGSCLDDPVKGGLGEYISKNSKELFNRKLSPKYASAIAAIMCEEGLLTFKDERPIKLKRIYNLK